MPRKSSDEFSARIHALNGGRGVNRGAARRGMVPLQRELARLAANYSERQRDVARRLNLIHAPLFDEKQADKVLRAFRSRYARSRRPRLMAPRVPKESPYIYLGSLGAIVAPPFNFSWTWRKAGITAGVYADAAKGECGFDCDSAGNDYDGSAAAAVGIYFRPVIDRGILGIWSFPSFASFWYDYAYFSAAASRAFIGLYVGRYDMAWKFTGAVVDQRYTLWDDSSHVSDSGWHNDSSRGYSMTASCLVDRSSQYIIWVWCWGHAFADRILGGAGAEAMLRVTVPAIAWQLT